MTDQQADFRDCSMCGKPRHRDADYCAECWRAFRAGKWGQGTEVESAASTVPNFGKQMDPEKVADLTRNAESFEVGYFKYSPILSSATRFGKCTADATAEVAQLRESRAAAIACQIEAETLLEEFDHYASIDDGTPYAGSPFQKRVHALLKPRWNR